MTSRTLSSNGFKQQFIWNLKSQKWLIMAFVAIRLLITALLSSIMCSSVSSSKEELLLSSSALRMLNDVTYQLTSPLTVIDIIIGTLFSFIILNTLFSFLYSKRKTDLYHGFPIKRGAFYWSAVAIPLLVNAISLIGEFAVIAVISKIYAAKSFADLGVILLSELLIYALLAAVTGVLALSISVSGVVASYIINILLLLIMLPVSLFMLLMSFESIIPAFANTFEGIWAVFPYGLLFADLIGEDIPFYISVPVSLAVAAVTLFSGLYFYRTRKSESSESYPSSSVPYNVGIMGVSVFAGVLAYMSSKNIFVAVIVASVIALAAMFLMNYIAEKRIKKSTVFYWLGFTAVFAGIMITAKYGTASYSNRIPEASQVESVEIDANVYGYGTADFISRIFGSSYMQNPSIKLESEESVNNVIDFHKEALESLKSKDSPISYVKLVYTLKGGDMITRILPYEYYYEEKSENTNQIMGSTELLESYDKIQKSDEYVQKQSMPYDKEDLASVYVSLNNRAILLKDDEAKTLLENYLLDVSDSETSQTTGASSQSSDIISNIITSVSGSSDYDLSGNSGYNLDIKFVFFTDKTTEAAKKVFYEIPLDAYRSLYQSNTLINVYNVQINTRTFKNTEKVLENSELFAQASALSEVGDDWNVVITPIDYSLEDTLTGSYEFVYPKYGGDSWFLTDLEADLSGNESGDVLIKTYVLEEYDFDRSYLMHKAESFSAEQAIEDLRAYKTGYVYYFTNNTDVTSAKTTKLYFATALK